MFFLCKINVCFATIKLFCFVIGIDFLMWLLCAAVCRALGLPARPVTAFVSAVDTQDTLTVDRFVDRFGDIVSTRDFYFKSTRCIYVLKQ